MTDAPALAITGATGAVGRLTAEELARGGTELRLLARSPGRAPQLPGAVVVQSSYGDGAQARAALEGVSTLLMVSAGEEEDWPQQQLGFVAAAADAGVEHIVYTSFQGASPEATFTYARDHFDTEEAIRASGMAWTLLRDSFYLDFVTLLPGADGALRGPAGEGRVAAVAKLDVARSAAAVLRDPAAHAGRAYEITGPEALSFADFAAALTASTGRTIRYVDEPMDEARRWREATGAPEWQLQGWLTTFAAIARGEHAHVSDDVELLTGRTPLSLRQLLLG
ncbi:SDR family oxidoreductase [Agrococcus baldri]|uniref:NAD(P)-dependent oxidoreductase n=1 Tax=Agrococcus baldri TaxID=153730 RepID=A0AA87RJG7_9MICO|nr:SDR family oxidoreductase [Agrococcus baldri]GEK81326.1 NAD(P)-dependent oxidoreductase [Agrococcus baldri]